MSNTLGVFTLFSALAPVEQDLVLRARKSANSSADHKLCFKSDFPVGSAILATNDQGETRVFEGCNIENDSFPATICAERNAATTAAFQGYKRFKVVALLCRKFPGGSPCGVCRQVLNQFGRDAILLNVCDHDNNVRRCTVGDLLPAAAGEPVPFAALSPADKRLVRRLAALKSKSYVPYSKAPRAALFLADNDKGKRKAVPGISDDNASYGASALAEAVAMRTARTSGYTRNVKLFVTVDDITAVNPIDGECLQILREFGADAPVVLVGPDLTSVEARLEQLFPDSFGPEAL